MDGYDARFEFLAALAPDRSVSAEDYAQLTRGMTREAKVDLVHWLGEAGIGVRFVPADRIALYHADVGRRYKPSRRETESGRFECPFCHVVLIRVTRKAPVDLFRCPDCAWCIAKSDIIDEHEPSGLLEPW